MLLYSYPPERGALMDGKSFAYFALFSEIGLVLFVTTFGGLLLGRWLDQQLGTDPWLVIGGFLLGMMIGAVANWRVLRRFLANIDD
ncbi:MAG: AtpZ/AtpI family protein [Candidatus Limnocylindrales bacterium]